MTLSFVDFKNLFDQSLIFEITPNPAGPYLYGSIVYGIFILIAIYLGVISRRQPKSLFRKLRGKLIYLLLFAGFVGPILTFFRWQSIPYLGSRLMVWILAIVSLSWLAEIISYRIFVLPREIIQAKEKENFEKYLPRH